MVEAPVQSLTPVVVGWGVVGSGFVGRRGDGSEEMDGLGNPFQGVVSFVLEHDAGAEDQFFHGASDENLRICGS